ncbi:MAG: MBL fold metallo-hydrolase [Pseudohongiella sp.]|nr:MAG: MBL fold metallo-hydrolase [Pseudohongiella sp.]
MNELDAGVAIPIETEAVPVKRLLGRNPGPMTGPGTNSYLIGERRLSLVDPGPEDAAQLESFLQAIGDAKLENILVTHTHGDHSPGALALQKATGARLVGLKAPDVPGHDKSFVPDRLWCDGEIVDCGEYRVQLISTPGHVSNHICFLLNEEQLLFTGDHVLQGTTSVILPPDGDMAAYLDALRRLLQIPLKALAPGHGGIMSEPHAEIEKLIAHRLKRERKIIASLESLGAVSLDELVLTVYDDVAKQLIPWAKRTLLAHLIKLQQEGRVSCSDEVWKLLPA